MKIAYFDCGSGISGDMTLGALIDLGAPVEAIQEKLDSLKLPDCRLRTETVKRHGFRATKLHVDFAPEHKHRHLHHIAAMIDGSTLSDRQKDLAHRMFRRLAEAEAKVHGSTIEKVHFHEVGAVDSIADVVGTAIAWDLLCLEGAVASPVTVGSGTIEIAHGRVNVPAPATVELLRGIPISETDVPYELATPTGAAILSTLASGYGPLPTMTIDAVGYGAGSRDLEDRPNVLRVVVGHVSETHRTESEDSHTEQVVVLETDVDNVTGERLGYCQLRLFEAGALDVYLTPLLMKKQRPGSLVTVICRPDKAEALLSILFAETGTLGVRESRVRRRVLPRTVQVVVTAYGPVGGKVATTPEGKQHFSPEYDECVRVARERGVPLEDVQIAAHAAYRSGGSLSAPKTAGE
ncbi:MAG TPA: nickel pincer cofactor biosynthesis protein LarC [Pirellulaceae bacterium]|jgi:hypothetical protein|nr:nickel pincer cofactor biosynthesis protein LarC [Pirellulaceae bacterium]